MIRELKLRALHCLHTRLLLRHDLLFLGGKYYTVVTVIVLSRLLLSVSGVSPYLRGGCDVTFQLYWFMSLVRILL